MPLGRLWSLVNIEGRIYLKHGTEIKEEFGYIIGARPNGEKDGQVKMKFSNLERPRALALSSFSWDDNPYSRIFKSCGDCDGFMNVWRQNHTTTSDSQASGSSNSSPQNSPAHQPTHRNLKRQASKPPALVPVPKTARTASKSVHTQPENNNDKEIEKHFIGFYMLPINILVEPPDPVLVRKTSRTFIDSLKQEMLSNPICDVQPILCMVCLKEGDEFAEKYKEAYKYQTIGGNHSRIALQEIVQDHPELAQNRIYTHRLCSVYTTLPTQLALCLASKHNRASVFCHEMTTWDKILMCRRLLYDMAGQENTDSVLHDKPPAAWKKSCSAILSQTVDQLDDGMIFYLSSLSPESFDLLTGIYRLYADGELKGQHVPRSKKGTMAKPPDLKGHKFKGLRGIDSGNVLRLLKEVVENEMTLQQLADECISLKLLMKVQAAFVKGTNSNNWQDAIDKYPDYCSSQQLEPFKKLSFSSKTLPDQFLQFCQRAMKPRKANPSLSTDDVFCVSKSGSCCIFWKQKCLEATPAVVKGVYEDAGLEFTGFSLSVVDTPFSSSESEIVQFVKEFRLMVCTLNYHVSLQEFTVILRTPLCYLGEIAKSLDGDDIIQLAVCNFYNKRTGIKAGSYSALEENVTGLLIIRRGNKQPLLRNEGNCFSFLEDPSVSKEHRPIAFCDVLMELFTNKGEWILDACGGVGSCAVAALKSERNCLTMESDSLLYFKGKSRVVDSIARFEKHHVDEASSEGKDMTDDGAAVEKDMTDDGADVETEKIE